MSLFSNWFNVPDQKCGFQNSVGSIWATFLTSLKVSGFCWWRNVKKGEIKYKRGQIWPHSPLLHCFKYDSMLVSNHNCIFKNILVDNWIFRTDFDWNIRKQQKINSKNLGRVYQMIDHWKSYDSMVSWNQNTNRILKPVFAWY